MKLSAGLPVDSRKQIRVDSFTPQGLPHSQLVGRGGFSPACPCLMIRWPSPRPRLSPADQRELDRLRNEAVLAWVAPDPMEEHLAVFLKSVDQRERKEVERSARRLFRAFERLLAKSPEGRPLDVILPELERRLRADFPWMSSDTFSRLGSYSHWMNWHG